MIPDAKLLSVSCRAKPMIKPATPRPARSGPRLMPNCDSATRSPKIMTRLDTVETIMRCARQTKKAEQEQAAQMANIQAQAQANAESAEKAAVSEVQKQQALAQTEIQIQQAKSQFEIQRMEQEALIKKQLMAEEFQYQLQLAQMNMDAQKQKEAEIENRKDQRVKIQGTQQSELIDQRQNDLLPKNFESGNDGLGGFDLEQFTPR